MKRAHDIQTPHSLGKAVRRSHRCVLVIALLSTATAAGVRAFYDDAAETPPSVFVPENLHNLEPDVLFLVRTHAERSRADPWDATHHGELGLVCEANRLWKSARSSFTNAVSLDPQDPGYRLHLAIATHELGHFEAALGILRKHVVDHVDDAAAQQRIGYLLIEDGEFAEAESAFRAVIRLRPEMPEGYVGLADVQLRQGRVESAMSLLVKALALDPRDRVAHNLLGTAYHRRGQSSEAAQHLALGQGAEIRYLSDPLSERAEKYAVNVRSRVKYGVRRLAEGDAQAAAKAFELALQTDPDHVVALNNLAGAYMRLGREHDAYQLLLKAKQLDQRKHSTYVNLATWMASQGRLEEALEHASYAVRVAPWIPQTHLTRVQVLLRLERFNQAKDALKEGLDRAGHDPALIKLAGSFGNLKRDENLATP